MKGQKWAIVPVLVGALDAVAERRYGEVFAPFLNDPGTLFVVSSDFCHWGERFQYQPTSSEAGDELHEFIEELDKQGMGLIERHDADEFQRYIDKTGNTICGRHPISVLLHAISFADMPLKTAFVAYAQSSHCVTESDSSVSYASAITRDAD